MKHMMIVTTENWDCISHGLKGHLEPGAVHAHLRPLMPVQEALQVFQDRAEHLCEYHQKRRTSRV